MWSTAAPIMVTFGLAHLCERVSGVLAPSTLRLPLGLLNDVVSPGAPDDLSRSASATNTSAISSEAASESLTSEIASTPETSQT